MDQEKELLKKELSGLETKDELEKFAEDAGLLGHEDVVVLAKQKLEEISKKAESVEQTSESQVSQIGTMGGSIEEVNNRTGEVDKKIEEVKTESEEKINEVQKENNENKQPNNTVLQCCSCFDTKANTPERNKNKEGKDCCKPIPSFTNTNTHLIEYRT